MSFGYQVLGFGAFPNREADYFIENAIMFDGGADYLSWTPSGAGTEETWTFSLWVKKSEFGSEMGLFEVQVDTSNRLGLRYGASSTDTLTAFGDISGSRKLQYNSDGVYRDPTAWQNIVISMNTTDGTAAANRFNMWTNGQTVSSTSPTYPDEDDVFNINTAIAHYIGRRGNGGGYFHGYLAEVIFLDGTASTDASEFGELNDQGVWVPKNPSGLTFGTNGFHLDFKSADIGNDVSGNNNDFTATSMGANNVAVDTCSDDSSAEPTIYTSLDPDNAINQGNAAIYSNSNLTASGNNGHVTLRTNNLTDGASKYVWEVTVTKHDPNTKIGASLPGDVISGGEQLGTDSSTGQGWAFISDNGDALYHNTAMSSNTAIVDGDMYHLEFDNDTGDVYVWRKASGGTWTAENSGNSVTSGSGKTALADKKVYLAGHLYQTSDTNLMTFNFSGPFDKTESSGYNPLTNTVTGVGNYATWNSISDSTISSSGVATLSNGNLTATSSSGAWRGAESTINLPASGKIGFELTMANEAQDGFNYPYIGIAPQGDTSNAGSVAWVYGFQGYNGNMVGSGVSGSLSGGGLSANDVVELLIDIDDGTAEIKVNGTSEKTDSSLTFNNSHCLRVELYSYALTVDFGQKGYVPSESDHKTLNTANLPAPTVTKPDDFFNTLTWSGDSSSPENITGLDFQPDLIWGKTRNATFSHQLYDSVRGFGNDKELQPDTTTVEGGGTADQYGYISGVLSNGFTATKGSDSGSDAYGYWNESGKNYVAWCWKAGDSNTAVSSSGSGNGATNACTHRANTTSGLSIIKYTGFNSTISDGEHTLVTHGLGTAPVFMMGRSLDTAQDWFCLPGENDSTGSGRWGFDNHMRLSTNDDSSGSLYVQPAFPSSTAVKVGKNDLVNKNGDEFIMYAWIRVPGMCAYGTYKGNGSSTDGTYVVVNDGGAGFKPAWIMIKNITSDGNWFVYDNQRNTHNVVNAYLIADDTPAEATSGPVQLDFIANGFKLRSANDATNGGSDTYMYLAMAEHPFGGDGIAQAKAR